MDRVFTKTGQPAARASAGDVVQRATEKRNTKSLNPPKYPASKKMVQRHCDTKGIGEEGMDKVFGESQSKRAESERPGSLRR
ncbi:hypothetical protein [Gracilimonas mengyeensis]|uniref:Uncharacterized protein n=1 Tax=Gracilimonas mengyeensis TaxID=1302730 RepID=A0A521BNK1_9BACT|nr:hypothetical protein [Gracilimonas mengyeensis]SMO48718.1 hypothetical protein SAMN06265219_102426 [Gracilimonas mengyeensis]